MQNSHLTIWDPDIQFPNVDSMFEPDVMTHVCVERAVPGGFHYLHETTIARHGDFLYAGWANHPICEHNTVGEYIRGARSRDGVQWTAAEQWLAPSDLGSQSWNHPVIFSQFDKLWGFFTRWNNEQPSTEVFTWARNGRWQSTSVQIPGFIPFRAPQLLPNGNWIISGELGWKKAAVAISAGDDFSQWHTVAIPCPPEIELLYAEATLLTRGEELIAIMRPHKNETAPVSISYDHGESWSSIQLSNFPMAGSQPYCGSLNTGQQFLVSNSHVDEGRTLLSIAVTRPGETVFSRIWKIRHSKTPLIRLLGHVNGTMVGKATQWSYPGVIEFNNNLYIIYTQGKEDCALSIIPLRVLSADAA